MRYEELPDKEKIPVLGLGTWQVGGGTSPDYSRDDEIVRAFRAALELGYTHIDTAEMYGGGHTEELVGQAIQDFNRQDLFIASKVWHTNLHYDQVLRSFRDSLERLGTDYLDLYLIHWPNPSVPLEETFRAFNELASQGRVRYVGVSNFNLHQLKTAQEVSESPLATNQVPYSLFNRQYADNGVLAYCQENGILLTAYTPIEKGSVAGSAALEEIGQKYGATPVQVALNWLISQPKVITIPMSTNPEHLQENLEAVNFDLSKQDMARLNQIA